VLSTVKEPGERSGRLTALEVEEKTITIKPLTVQVHGVDLGQERC
jgi:hypothetical protein